MEHDAEVMAAALPGWMRAAPTPNREVPANDQVELGAELDLVDETPDVERLPAWMRAGRRSGRTERPEWLRSTRSSRGAKAHWDAGEERGAVDAFYPDETPDPARLPVWMRSGGAKQINQASWSEDADVGWEAAWRRWDGIDPPAPEEDAAAAVELEW